MKNILSDKSISEIYNIKPLECPVITSVQDQEQREVKAILTAFDETIFYGQKPETRPVAKPADVISVLVQVLVSKGLLSLQDVQRALNTSTGSGT